MQTTLQVHSKSSRSLRDQVLNHLDRHSDEFRVEYHHRHGRQKGWAKVKANCFPGALNVSWDPETKVMTVRAITRGQNTPNELIGYFLSHLLERHRSKIAFVTLRP
jgi:hypothetical protein